MTSRLRSDVNPGLTRKMSTPCQNLMLLHTVHCQNIGRIFKYDFAFDAPPSRSTHRHRIRLGLRTRLPRQQGFDPTSKFESKEL